MKWLIYGANGWIGSYVCDLLNDMDEIIIKSSLRVDNEKEIEKELLSINPDRVISLIGRTSGPGYSTIDYLEQKGKLVENINDNLYSPLILAILCTKYNIHLTYLGTGCIFNGYKNNIGYNENDIPDFYGSAYSTVKGFTDRLMHLYENNVLNCRIRMPIVNNNNPKNFITKIMTYKKICNQYNSMTVLPELLPIMIDMAKNKTVGTINLTNPGIICHNEILEMVKEIIDPNFTWENFSIEEQDKILLSARSNNLLDTTRLETLYPNVMKIKDSIRYVLTEMKKTM